MDESQALDALANFMNDLAENPFDIPTHLQHIRLAESFPGMEAEAMSAREMMSQFLAVGEDIWLPLLDAKESSLDLETEEGVSELLALYERAEADYLSIPILEKHLKFIIERYTHYASSDNEKPENLAEMFTIDWTREALNQIVTKGLIHITESHRLWDLWKDWELKMLENSSPAERPLLVEHVHKMLLQRVCQIHSKMEETFQAYSSFTTDYLPAENYEKLLVSASKMRGQTVRNWEWREPQESKLEKSGRSLQAFHEYALYERRARKPDLFVIRGIYERAITEAAYRRHKGETGVEEALQIFWLEYCDALRLLDASLDERREAFRRAIRSVPGSGEVWARYIRFLERLSSSGEQYDGMETVADVFDHALAMKIVQKDANQLVPLVLARAGYERRQLDESDEDEDALPTLIALLERGISSSRQASDLIDQSLRLEKFLASVYEHYGLIDSVFDVWKDAAQYSRSSYQVWFNYTESLIKHKKYDEAREVFTNIHADKRVNWPEAIWDAWMSFEHMHGTLTDIENCIVKVEKAQQQTNARRAKEAEKAAYGAMQATVATQVDNPAAIPEVANVSTANAEGVPMQVDSLQPHAERGTKRGVEDEDPEASNHKKARMEQKPPPLKRDRENCEVFVGDLPVGVTKDDLLKLFKDCGSVMEVKITNLPSGSVATVEFTERDSVPAALTKDKKRLQEQEISVHLAWKSTLYITNFPATANDKFIRDLFGKYGEIFDVRWPSKKFKSTRRFCYVQYTTTDAAKDALQLHGRELEPNLPLNVLLSNPDRKKERTDADANQKILYVAGLSKYTAKADLEKVFSTYGTLKDVRIALDDNGHAKGYAFVEYEEASDASRALGANNYELKKRRIAVTLADPRIRARHKSDIGLSQVAEARTRSVYVSNLPPATQEGLLQQVLESIAPVKRVEVFLDKREAVVQLENPADVGRLLLRSEPIVFGGNALKISEDMPSSRANKDRVASFKPRNLGPSRPKAGLGFKSTAPKTSASVTASSSGGKGQDDFRKMLERK